MRAPLQGGNAENQGKPLEMAKIKGFHAKNGQNQPKMAKISNIR